MAVSQLKEQAMNSATRLASKTITATRDLTAASGDVAYTGVGFVPTSIICFYGIEGAVYGGMGIVDSAKTEYSQRTDALSAYAFNGNLVTITSAAGGFQEGIVKTYDADGFTLTWTKTSSPTGTMQMRFLCFR